jgi:hypothetical protein
MINGKMTILNWEWSFFVGREQKGDTIRFVYKYDRIFYNGN